MIRIAGSVSKSWLASELNVVFDRDYYFDVQRRQAIDMRCNAHVAQTLGDLNVFYTESNLGRREWYDSQQALVGGIQPNLIVGMLAGAEFLPVSDADADITATCLLDRDLASLPRPSELLAHPLVCHWSDEIRGLLHGDDTSFVPVAPFFWDRSGRAAVHGAVTSGLKFFGDAFLMDLLSQPDRCESIVGWLTDVSATLVAHFAEVSQQPVSSIHVGECAACMLDVASFERFVVPATSQLGERFGQLRFHSCGCSDHVLEACRQITGLAELDVGGETSVKQIRRVFGRDFPVGIAPLVGDMRADSADSILAWFHRVAQENDEGNLTIGFHLESDYRVENLRALVRAVRSRSGE